MIDRKTERRIRVLENLHAGGTYRDEQTTRITSADSPYTILAADKIIFCDTDGGAIEIDLPAGVDGAYYKCANCGSSGNDLTVDPDGTEQVYGSGAGTAVTLTDGEVIDIHFDSTEGWW